MINIKRKVLGYGLQKKDGMEATAGGEVSLDARTYQEAYAWFTEKYGGMHQEGTEPAGNSGASVDAGSASAAPRAPRARATRTTSKRASNNSTRGRGKSHKRLTLNTHNGVKQ